jgi:hypothetical protein
MTANAGMKTSETISPAGGSQGIIYQFDRKETDLASRRGAGKDGVYSLN